MEGPTTRRIDSKPPEPTHRQSQRLPATDTATEVQWLTLESDGDERELCPSSRRTFRGKYDQNNGGGTALGSHWSERDGSPGATLTDRLRTRASKRLAMLQGGRRHEASPYYEFDVVGAKRRPDNGLVGRILACFSETLRGVSEHRVRRWFEQRREQFHEFHRNGDGTLNGSTSNLNPYGGDELLALAAAIDVAGLTDRELWESGVFEREFDQFWSSIDTRSRVSKPKGLRKLFELRDFSGGGLS